MQFNIRRFAVSAVLLSALAFAPFARAHQPGLSTLFVDLGTNRIVAQIIVAWQELEEAVPLDTNRDRKLSDDELSAARTRLVRIGETALSLESDGRMLSLKSPV